MPNFVYDKGKNELATAATGLASSDLRCMLMKSSHVPSQGGHHFVSDVVADEISVTGYSRQVLTTKTVTEDDTGHAAYLTADNAVFSSLAAGQTIGFAIVYRNSGSDASSPLLGLYVLTAFATNGGNVTIVWASAGSGGVLKLSS